MIGRLLRGGFMTAIYAYLYIPIIILIVNSFNSSRFGINWQGFTTNWYSLLMNNDSLLQAAQHSLTMAIFSATFATLIGSSPPWRSTAIAFAVSRSSAACCLW
jgi:spermidine/putrescine transport system permease protein